MGPTEGHRLEKTQRKRPTRTEMPSLPRKETYWGSLFAVETDLPNKRLHMNATMSNDTISESVPETIQEGENEEDEEVRMALEMAMAAAQNPGLTPAQLRDLVGKKNKQADIVDQIKKEKEQKAKEEQEKAKEEAVKKWNMLKNNMMSRLSHSITDSKNAIRAAAESLQTSAEMQIYAEAIKKDPEVQELRKKIKHARKNLKTMRLSGNRVATRHRFKRHRMESTMLSHEERIEKARKLFVDTNFGLQEYGKAILRASRKYKNGGSKEEEKQEAMLCRNMHQMLSIDKQKAKMRKSNKEIKKYMQRCKSWVSDKQALCESNVMKLEATHNSMQALYEDTLERHEKLIQKLKESDDFKDVNLADVDVSYFDEIPKNAGPRGMLCALRGLPFSDSIRKLRSSGSVASSTRGKRKELIIQTRDDASVSSHLTDPDGDLHDFESLASAESGPDDAPWNTPDAGLSPKKKKPVKADASKTSMKEDLDQPPSTITTHSMVKEGEAEAKPAPSVPAEKVVEGKTEEPVERPVEETEPIKEESTPSTEKEKNGAEESVETNPCSMDSEPEGVLSK